MFGGFGWAPDLHGHGSWVSCISLDGSSLQQLPFNAKAFFTGDVFGISASASNCLVFWRTSFTFWDSRMRLTGIRIGENGFGFWRGGTGGRDCRCVSDVGVEINDLAFNVWFPLNIGVCGRCMFNSGQSIKNGFGVAAADRVTVGNIGGCCTLLWSEFSKHSMIDFWIDSF